MFESDELYGELGRKDCQLRECDGERVWRQSKGVPVGCAEMECTGECGAFSTLDYRSDESGVSRVRFEVSVEEAFGCPSTGCEETVGAHGGYNLEWMPFDGPGEVERATFHECESCGREFTVGETPDGERRVVELEAE
jgi:hypothetical protein